MSALNTSMYSYTGIQQVAIYMGMPILIIGVFGEILIIIVFLSLKTFREKSCAFYLTIMSLFNVGQLLFCLFPQIMIQGFDIDLTRTSVFYCKCRIFIRQLCTLMSCTCMGLATMDQFFATCSTTWWQQLSNIKLARILTSLYFIIWICHGIPFLIYIDIVRLSPNNELYCTVTNRIFLHYFQYGFVIILAGFFPIFITVLFSLLAYRNVQKSMYQIVPLIRRELDKQLTVMVLVIVAFNSITTIPYIVVYIIMRGSIPIQDPILFLQLQFSSTVFSNIYFLHFASSLYIYVCVSERFRRQLIYVLFGMHRRQTLPANHVSP
ncbi:unnamed protein product [Adineta steineri]|uniref:G-protein coupled receptors family 1 profile domain-containing protein n=1 Tax=Adineta steineri TaxID=433720 RepID=A0A813MI92_9BILA|nr:unnamed protein product [Adineta steineri]CAF1142368.1 unnamed protein product [Adineta steineri]